MCDIKSVLKVRYKSPKANSCLLHTHVQYLIGQIGSLNWSACILGYFLQWHYVIVTVAICVWRFTLGGHRYSFYGLVLNHYFSFVSLLTRKPFSFSFLLAKRSTLCAGHYYDLNKRDRYIFRPSIYTVFFLQSLTFSLNLWSSTSRIK